MRKAIALLLFALAAQPMLAKDNWPLTIKVLSTRNLEDPHGSFHFAKVFDNASAAWSHRVAEHVFVDASDGNSYELVPQNSKDMLLPGTFQAKIEKRDMKVCEPKDNGHCREVKFKIVTAVPTVEAAEATPEHAESIPRTTEPTAGATSASGAQASLIVSSTPPGADIDIDGAFVGNTPSTVTVSAGSHEIVVKKQGYSDWSRKLNVTGGSVHLDATLSPSTGN